MDFIREGKNWMVFSPFNNYDRTKNKKYPGENNKKESEVEIITQAGTRADQREEKSE